VAAGAGRVLPLSRPIGDWSIRIEGRPYIAAENPNADFHAVTPGYFDAMRLRLVRGRALTAADREDTMPVAVINETMADRYWPGEEAIGRQFMMGTARDRGDRHPCTLARPVGDGLRRGPAGSADVPRRAVAARPRGRAGVPGAGMAGRSRGAGSDVEVATDYHGSTMVTHATRGATTLVFLLSPAHCGGRRAAILLKPGAASLPAQRLRAGTLSLGEAFSFMSGLYFRGKLSYARAFAAGPDAESFVITPTRGLQPPDTPVSVEVLQEFAGTDIAAGDVRYRGPLERDLVNLSARLAESARVILLGSIASDKYVDVLAPALGERLHYPPSFIGRGDMSRGGLLLRSAASGVELEYEPLDPAAARRGPRPPKLEPLKPGHG
jgi:hypothetical protein